ncbi:hypothetical protein FN846DRAFT_906726 [Sphaerosporella brunnea]|uniref:Uncharacterized protein n=1 Tax=Sphaerosporella brunnea TaxID=1250544 RepID=A0A5J5EYV9_9PEZI|nr:hypothetical protein FN846DRAFT_906726 [Sphaerosporella brunnea]
MANVVYQCMPVQHLRARLTPLFGYNGGYVKPATSPPAPPICGVDDSKANPKAFEYYPGKGLELLRRHGFKIPPQKSIGQKRKAEDGRPDCAKKIRSGEATATQKPRNDDSEVAATTSTKKRSRAASPEDDQDIPILKKVLPRPHDGRRHCQVGNGPETPSSPAQSERAATATDPWPSLGHQGHHSDCWSCLAGSGVQVFLIASPPVGLIEKMGGLFRVPPTSGWLTDARIMRYGEWSNSYTETLLQFTT